MELMIWAGGRWRRVCSASGRVAGWRRRAKILCNRRGILRELAPAVAFASIVKGPALPKIRKRKVKLSSEVYISTQTGSPSISCQKNPAAFSIKLQRDASMQTDTRPLQVTAVARTHSNKVRTSPHKALLSQQNKENQYIKAPEKRNFRSISTEILEPRSNDEQKSKTNEAYKKSNKEKTKEDLNDVDKAQKNDKQKTTKEKTDSTASSEECFKELVIGEQDVLLLRRYVETHDTWIDLYKFDCDESYKTSVFYKINPLVKMERCDRIAQMLKERDVHVTVHFARQLGLRSVDDAVEPDVSKTRRRHRAAKQAAMARSTIDKTNQPRKTKKNKDLATEDSDNDIEQIKDSKTKTAQTITKENSKIVSSEHKKDTQDIVDSKNEEKQTENGKGVCRKRAKSLTDENNDEEPQKKRLQTESNIKDSDEIVNIKAKNHAPEDGVLAQKAKLLTNGDGNGEPKSLDKIIQTVSEVNVSNGNDRTRNISTQKTIDISEIASESDEEFESSKIRDVFKQKSTKMIQNNDDNAREAPAVETTSSKDGGKEKVNNNEIVKNTLKFNLGTRRIAVPKRSSVRPGREYSTLEDQAIVAWVSAATERERAVNGNRIWKQLEDGYTRLTGQTRTWHSLRNRYLRYILPGLDALALSDAHAQRLRAHATLGELKARKNRRNSAFRLPCVRSASGRAPKPHKDNETTIRKYISSSDTSESESDSPKNRHLRSSSGRANQPTDPNQQSPHKTYSDRSQSPNKTGNHPQSPKNSDHRSRSRRKADNRTKHDSQSSNKLTNRTQSPVKSDNRRQSPVKASKRMQSPSKASKGTQSPTKRVQSPSKASNRMQSPSKAVRQSRSPRSSPTYSELTRRFALRNRSTPHSSPKPVVHHKRRLYNPQRLTSNSSPAT